MEASQRLMARLTQETSTLSKNESIRQSQLRIRESFNMKDIFDHEMTATKSSQTNDIA
jgi:hypothetical protein